MAKIPQGILGGIRGRVGNIVGAAWKGINYIRSMPLSVANPNPASQQAQRGAFTQVVLVARLGLSSLIAPYWDPFARAMSGYNYFISRNIAAFNTAGLNLPAQFDYSRGILTGVDNLAAVFDDSDNNVVVTWDDNSGDGDALATDTFNFGFYNVTQDYWILDGITADVRSNATGTYSYSRPVAGDVIEFYAFFQRPDVSRISDSAHLQTTVVA